MGARGPRIYAGMPGGVTPAGEAVLAPAGDGAAVDGTGDGIVMPVAGAPMAAPVGDAGAAGIGPYSAVIR
jgi:hypothetical protein